MNIEVMRRPVPGAFQLTSMAEVSDKRLKKTDSFCRPLKS